MAAGKGSNGVPTPWWQTPGNNSAVPNLEKSAPDGYTYDPVQQQYVRTPASAGANLGTYADSALEKILGPGSTLGGQGGGLSALMGAAGVPGGAGGGSLIPPATAGAAPTAPTVPPVKYDAGALAAAHAAAFGQAKDEAAATAKSSLSSLRSALSARGAGGAGYEAGQTGKVLGTAANTIGAASRQEAQDTADLMTHAADENFSGALEQGGQNLAAATAAQGNATAQRGQDVAQRGQDLAANEAAANLAFQNNALKANQSLALLKVALGLVPNVSVSGGSNGGSFSTSLY